MAAAERLHITLKGAGILIERDVPEGVASELIRLLLGDAPSAEISRRSGGHEQGQRTLAESFQHHQPKRNPDKIAVIAYHFKEVGRATFTKDEVRGGFRQAGEREPGNFDRDWSWAVRNGWIGGDANEGFYITRTGGEVVRGNFARDLLERTKLKAKRKVRHDPSLQQASRQGVKSTA